MTHRARRSLLAALAVVLAPVAALAAALVADRLYPPDLSRYRDASVTIEDRRGEILRAYVSADEALRLTIDADRVDPRYLDMLVAYEDKRFHSHFGIDPLALGRALAQFALSGRLVSGGSTLTMQTARLLEPRPRTLGAKLIEMLRALQLEARFSKREILGIYLTLAPFGGNIEGARAASLVYFGKEPGWLTNAQAALLVALPQSPTRRRPDRHPEAALGATLRVLDRLERAGLLDSASAGEARAEAHAPARRPLPFSAPHLADRLKANAPPGKLRTSLDAKLQRAAETLLTAESASYPDGAQIAAIMVENATGKVRTYVGGGNFFGPAGQVDLARAIRSPGSTLKPFIYGTALDDLIVQPHSILLDQRTSFGTYTPVNFDREFHGQVTAREALQQSLNVPAVGLLDRIGPERLAALLRAAGARLVFPKGMEAPSLPLALGGVGISLEHLTHLYLAIADRGQARPLSFIENEPARPAMALMSERAAWLLTDILADAPGPEAMGRVRTQADRAIAYKTGTSYGFRDAWAMGWSTSHTIGLWVGRADGTPRPGAYGRNTAARLLFKLFDLLPGEIEAFPIRTEAMPKARGSVLRTPADPPRITFPPGGADLPLAARRNGEPATVKLRAEGGRAPLAWSVNGEPIPSRRGEAEWYPDGIGFTRVVVTDADGLSAAVEFRLSR